MFAFSKAQIAFISSVNGTGQVLFLVFFHWSLRQEQLTHTFLLSLELDG